MFSAPVQSQSDLCQISNVGEKEDVCVDDDALNRFISNTVDFVLECHEGLALRDLVPVREGLRREISAAVGFLDPAKNIWLESVPPGTTDEDLFEFSKQFGHPTWAKVCESEVTICFSSVEEATSALTKLQGAHFRGMPLVASVQQDVLPSRNAVIDMALQFYGQRLLLDLTDEEGEMFAYIAHNLASVDFEGKFPIDASLLDSELVEELRAEPGCRRFKEVQKKPRGGDTPNFGKEDPHFFNTRLNCEEERQQPRCPVSFADLTWPDDEESDEEFFFPVYEYSQAALQEESAEEARMAMLEATIQSRQEELMKAAAAAAKTEEHKNFKTAQKEDRRKSKTLEQQLLASQAQVDFARKEIEEEQLKHHDAKEKAEAKLEIDSLKSQLQELRDIQSSLEAQVEEQTRLYEAAKYELSEAKENLIHATKTKASGGLLKWLASICC